MIYIVQCQECQAKEEYLGSMTYFQSWLETHRCKFCGGTLAKIPAESNFKVDGGTETFYGGKK